MRLFILFLIFLNSSLSVSSGCPDWGPKCTKFVSTLLGKLTTKFAVTDKIVCMIGTDLGRCIGDANTYSYCGDVMTQNESAYMSQLGLEKASMLSDLMSFQSCLSDSDDLSLTDFLSQTIVVSLQSKIEGPFNKTILPKMKTMKANGKPFADRIEEACKLGTAMATPDLISQIVKKDMLLTFKDTWKNCVMGKIVPKSILTIGKFIKSAFKNKAKSPSG